MLQSLEICLRTKDLGNSICLEKTEKDHHHRPCLPTQEDDFSNSGREKADRTQYCKLNYTKEGWGWGGSKVFLIVRLTFHLGLNIWRNGNFPTYQIFISVLACCLKERFQLRGTLIQKFLVKVQWSVLGNQEKIIICPSLDP